MKLWNMNDNRLGGIALIVGMFSGIITMIFHPVTAGHRFTPAEFETFATINIATHSLAIAGLPFLFIGALALTRRLNSPGRVAVTALAIYGFGLVAIMIAPALSGLAGTEIIQQGIRHPETELWAILMAYNFILNQAFSAIFVIATCAAIGLWSVMILRTGRIARGLGVYGVILGPITAVALFSGALRLDVHGFGIAILTQAIWFITAGILLLRIPGSEDNR